MAEAFPILLAAELLPLELPVPGAIRSTGGLNVELLPILAAALLVVTLLTFLLAFTRRRKRKHRTHRPRNPTLAETGGLPPPRQT
jgi:uncharacterized membrane protein YozB (DUF420 family)